MQDGVDEMRTLAKGRVLLEVAVLRDRLEALGPK